MNRCERCGQAVPDGLPICPECLKTAGAGEAEVTTAEELRDIAAILRIEAGTDANKAGKERFGWQKRRKSSGAAERGRGRGADGGPPLGYGIRPPRPPCRSTPYWRKCALWRLWSGYGEIPRQACKRPYSRRSAWRRGCRNAKTGKGAAADENRAIKALF